MKMKETDLDYNPDIKPLIQLLSRYRYCKAVGPVYIRTVAGETSYISLH